MIRDRRWILFLALVLGCLLQAQSQLLPPFQPEQDCPNAIAVCQDTFFQPFSYQGEGLDPNEINFRLSCLGLGEENDAWYVFTIQQPGNLAFTITPNDPLDDYDWAVYNLSNHSCADIRTNASLEVGCNYSPQLGPTGANGQGTCGNNPNCPVIPVSAGQTYVLNVSNWNTPRSGYLLDFRASTAVLYDSISPRLDTVVAPCGDSVLEVVFSEPVKCATVSPVDFMVSGPGGPYTVTGVSGANCNPSGGFERRFTLSLNPPVSAQGWYRVSLVDTVLDNCENLALQGTDSTVVSLPAVALQASPDTLCPGDSSQLMGTITPGLGGFSSFWSPATLSGQSPLVAPAASQTYTLFAEDSLSGCLVSTSAAVHVRPAPVPNFSLSPSRICVDDTITLAARGAAVPAAIYQWGLGQGQVLSGTGAGPLAVRWNVAGPDTVCLTTLFQGCVSEQNCLPVEALPRPQSSIQPVGDQCFAGNAFAFSPAVTQGLAGFQWSFGDGQFSSLLTPLHQYAGAGQYAVSLVVSDSAGCQDTATLNVTVFPSPRAGFAADPVCQDETLIFQDSSAIDSGGTINGWLWDFGDGTQASGRRAGHAYLQTGTYPVRLIVSSTDGCSDTLTQALTVFPRPEAGFTFTPACAQTQPVRFTDTSTYQPPGLSWIWQFGDGNTASLPNPSHVYARADTYGVVMVLSNRYGCSDTAYAEVEVFPRPVPGFVTDPGCAGDSLRFVQQAFLPPGYAFRRFLWDFGDGTRGEGDSVWHVFPVGGSFPVQLIAVSEQGCRDTLAQAFEVYPRPLAGFTVTPACEGDTLRFQDQSLGAPGDPIAFWRYDFGDGGGALGQNPRHLYSAAGSWPVTLWVQSSRGCRDSVQQEAEVFPLPEPLLLLPDTVCRGETAALVVRPGLHTASVNWYERPNQTEPFHQGENWTTESLEARKTVYVEPVSIEGCLGGRQALTAQLFPDFQGWILVSDSVLELPEASVAFGVTGNRDLLQHLWDFGDGNGSEEPAPIHRYDAAGTYVVMLSLWDENDCPAFLSQNIEVQLNVSLHLPTAFSPNGDGYNDLWYLPGTGIQQLDLQVLDRWGKVVFQTQDPGFHWDGRDRRGSMVPEGVYVVRLLATDLEEKTFSQVGTVTVMR